MQNIVWRLGRWFARADSTSNSKGEAVVVSRLGMFAFYVPQDATDRREGASASESPFSPRA
jgi:hypothetical protein